MKKKILLTLSMVFISLFVFCMVNASAETSGEWTYEINCGEITLTSYEGSADNLIIPSEIEGFPVKKIGGGTFNNVWFTDVEISEGITNIESDAFSYCPGLVNVKIPKSVTDIAEGAFGQCELLGNINVDINNNYYLSENGVLFDKEKKILIRYPATKTDESYIIPDSITSIGSTAFAWCGGLTNIEIPDSVISIGDGAFLFCGASIEIPDSVISIGGGAFRFTRYYYDDNAWEGDALYVDQCLVSVRGTISGEYKIKEGTRIISGYAFNYCDGLTSIEIPDSTTNIGDRAFCSCDSLVSINVDINNQYYSSENGVLFDKEKKILIQYPAGKSDKFYAVPDSVTSIGDGAFYNCSSLVSIDIPNGVTKIGDEMFYSCSSLTNIKIPDGTTSIGDRAFYNCSSLVSIEIPNGVRKIGEEMFYKCSSLTNIKIPDGTTSIGNRAFYNCSSLVSIEIPNGVRKIGTGMFYNCSSLTKVKIPDSVMSIAYGVFFGCGNLQEMILPFVGSSREANETSDAVFGYIFGIHEYENSTDVRQNYRDYIGYYYEHYETYYIPITLKKITITDAKIIPYGAFHGCRNLTEIEINDGVTNVGRNAFIGCGGLTSIIIPDSVTTICRGAFDGCRYLTTIYIGSGVTYIEEDDHYGPSYTFLDCENLKTIYFSGSKEDINMHNVSIPNTVKLVYNYKPSFTSTEITSATSTPTSLKFISEVTTEGEPEIETFGTTFIPLWLFEIGGTNVATAQYDNSKYNIQNGQTFGATLNGIPESCKDMAIVGKSFIKDADGNYTWSAAKSASVNDATLVELK